MLTQCSLLPQILDPCCGGRMFYFDKHDPRVMCSDIRCEEHVLCDGRVFTVSPDSITANLKTHWMVFYKAVEEV